MCQAESVQDWLRKAGSPLFAQAAVSAIRCVRHWGSVCMNTGLGLLPGISYFNKKKKKGEGRKRKEKYKTTAFGGLLIGDPAAFAFDVGPGCL